LLCPATSSSKQTLRSPLLDATGQVGPFHRDYNIKSALLVVCGKAVHFYVNIASLKLASSPFAEFHLFVSSGQEIRREPPEPRARASSLFPWYARPRDNHGNRKCRATIPCRFALTTALLPGSSIHPPILGFLLVVAFVTWNFYLPYLVATSSTLSSVSPLRRLLIHYSVLRQIYKALSSTCHRIASSLHLSSSLTRPFAHHEHDPKPRQ